MFVYKPVYAYAKSCAIFEVKSNKSYVRAIEWLSCLLGSVRIVNREFDHKSISDDETVVSITSYHF